MGDAMTVHAQPCMTALGGCRQDLWRQIYVDVVVAQHHGFLIHDIVQGTRQGGGRGWSGGGEGGDEEVLELVADFGSISSVGWILWQRMEG